MVVAGYWAPISKIFTVGSPPLPSSTATQERVSRAKDGASPTAAGRRFTRRYKRF